MGLSNATVFTGQHTSSTSEICLRKPAVTVNLSCNLLLLCTLLCLHALCYHQTACLVLPPNCMPCAATKLLCLHALCCHQTARPPTTARKASFSRQACLNLIPVSARRSKSLLQHQLALLMTILLQLLSARSTLIKQAAWLREVDQFAELAWQRCQGSSACLTDLDYCYYILQLQDRTQAGLTEPA